VVASGGASVRAIVCQGPGEPESVALGDVPEPSLEAGQLRIGVQAAGVNFADTLMVRGTYQDQPPFPLVPGLEAAGEVLEVGAGVEGWRPGDPVFALLDSGGFAETAVARAEDCYPIPNGLGFVEAAGFSVAYGSSHLGLRLARLHDGETLLVHGAAGGVGLAAVEIGHALGARVIATAGGQERLAVAREHGADLGIDYRAESIRDRVLELTDGRGADVVFDPVGGDVFAQSLSCVGWGARLLVVGFASGEVPQIPANHVLVKNVSVIGYTLGAYRRNAPDLVRASFAELFEWHAAGRLRPHVSSVLPLARAAEALRLLLTGP
jgi:NADPH2:quinone reductase